MKLLNPGPVTLTERVRRAMLREDTCHREAEFAALTRSVIERLAHVYEGAERAYTPVLLTGSGTAAVEAMIGTLVPKEGNALIVANGVYGERAAAMLEAQGKRHRLVRAPWTSPIDMREASFELGTGAFTHCIAVHHETTTGRLNDIAWLAEECRANGVPLLLDAVSSFGGEEIRFEEWDLLACAATANKCLHGVPGIAFVVAKTSALASGATGATSVYLDLKRYFREQQTGFSPFTQAVQSMFALDEALAELADEGGWRARNARYAARTKQLKQGLSELGITMLLDDERAYSSILTSYKMPKNVTYERLHDELKREGFVIYAGQGSFTGEIFRVAVMGDVSGADVERLLDAVRSIVR